VARLSISPHALIDRHYRGAILFMSTTNRSFAVPETAMKMIESLPQSGVILNDEEHELIKTLLRQRRRRLLTAKFAERHARTLPCSYR
jgi:hypothetical protein